jgi:hypothetical protein
MTKGPRNDANRNKGRKVDQERIQAELDGLRLYWGKPCKKGHVNEKGLTRRLTRTGLCEKCRQIVETRANLRYRAKLPKDENGKTIWPSSVNRRERRKAANG